jgi:hypothetical protein
MWHKVKDLSGDQRLAIESLLGRRLADDEGLNIQPSRVLKEAPTGAERAAAYGEYLNDLNRLGGRADGIPDAELDAIIDEACDHVRHSPS